MLDDCVKGQEPVMHHLMYSKKKVIDTTGKNGDTTVDQIAGSVRTPDPSRVR